MTHQIEVTNLAYLWSLVHFWSKYFNKSEKNICLKTSLFKFTDLNLSKIVSKLNEMKRKLETRAKGINSWAKSSSVFFNEKIEKKVKQKNSRLWLTLVAHHYGQKLLTIFAWRVSISLKLFSTHWISMKVGLLWGTHVGKWN